MPSRKKRGFVDNRRPRVEPVPKVMLHPATAVRLRTVAEQIDANVAFAISWRHVVEMMRENESLRAEETVEALVLNDLGIQVYVQTNKGAKR